MRRLDATEIDQVNAMIQEEHRRLAGALPDPGELDRQRLHVLKMHTIPAPCPVCREPVNKILASAAFHSTPGQLANPFRVRETRTHHEGEEYEHCCPYCGMPLQFCVPFIGPALVWQLALSKPQMQTLLNLVAPPGSETAPGPGRNATGSYPAPGPGSELSAGMPALVSKRLDDAANVTP